MQEAKGREFIPNLAETGQLSDSRDIDAPTGKQSNTGCPVAHRLTSLGNRLCVRK